MAGCFTQSLVELELDYKAHKVPDIRHVSRDVEFGAGVKVILSAGNRWTQPLVLHSEVPPLLVIFCVWDAAIKNFPSPLIHEVTEWQEGNLVQGHTHQEVDNTVMVVLHHIQQSDLLQVSGRGYQQGQHIPNGLMEARVGA